jgi:hypothetical protein
VAGKNPDKRTIVIDVAVYPGNSGGPVIAVDPVGGSFVPIGIVSQYVPLVDEWHNVNRGCRYSTISTSEYSIVEPLDPVIDIIRSWR